MSTIGPPKVMRRVDISPTNQKLDLRQRIELCVLEESLPNLQTINIHNVSSRRRIGWVTTPPYHCYASIKCVRPSSCRLRWFCHSKGRSTNHCVHILFFHFVDALTSSHNIIIIINGIFGTQSNFTCTIFGFLFDDAGEGLHCHRLSSVASFSSFSIRAPHFSIPSIHDAQGEKYIVEWYVCNGMSVHKKHILKVIHFEDGKEENFV